MEEKSPELVPLDDEQGPKKDSLRKICVKVYLNEQDFLKWVRLAEEAGIRPRGLKPFVKKPHGFEWERLANTKGLVKFLKKRVVPYWVIGADARRAKEAEIKAEAEKLGLKVGK